VITNEAFNLRAYLTRKELTPGVGAKFLVTEPAGKGTAMGPAVLDSKVDSWEADPAVLPKI